MKAKLIFPVLLTSLLASCSRQIPQDLSRTIPYCFGTGIYYKLYEGSSSNLDDIQNIFENLDALTDNYLARSVKNIYSINHTNEEVAIDETLYDLLSKANGASIFGASYFNLLAGSLSNKWKESLANNEVLSSQIIEEELAKINSTSLLFKENNIVQRIGEAEIDLGGIAKGYALDLVKTYLNSKNIRKFLINAGKSSVFLGEKDADNGFFTVELEDVPGIKMKLKNCFISTSATSVQGRTIDGVSYSHIINPITGSAINNFDAVIVISDSGYIGDALSTSMMMNTIDEIKAIEEAQNVKCITIKDHQMTYRNPSIEVTI